MKFSTPGRTIFDTDIVNFIALSGMYEDLFCNLEYIQNESAFKQRIAPGALTFIITMGLLVRTGLFEKSGLADTDLLSQLRVLGYGSTIAINALLTRNGTRVGLITTRGFEDTPIMMRGKAGWVDLTHEEKMHVITQKKPEPLVPRELIRGVTERVDILGKVVLPVREEHKRLIATYGVDYWRRAFLELIEDGERQARAKIARLPDG